MIYGDSHKGIERPLPWKPHWRPVVSTFKQLIVSSDLFAIENIKMNIVKWLIIIIKHSNMLEVEPEMLRQTSQVFY